MLSAAGGGGGAAAAGPGAAVPGRRGQVGGSPHQAPGRALSRNRHRGSQVRVLQLESLGPNPVVHNTLQFLNPNPIPAIPHNTTTI